MDNRNYEVTGKIFEVLNMVKGFDVAISNPGSGKIITRYNGVSFCIDIQPIFNDNESGRKEDNKSFSEIVRNNEWMLR